MLTEHQAHLREGVEVSHPRLDALLDAALAAGALGGKLNGSGGGGAIFVYAPGRQEEVAQALAHAGGKSFVVSPRSGVTVEID
jgi:galactokinase